MRVSALSDIGQDIAHFGRSFRRSPGFFATCAATIALGIALTTVLVSVVDAVLMRPLPFRDAERLVTVGAKDGSFTLPGVPVETLDAWKAPGAAMDQMENYVESELEVGGAMEPGSAKATKVSGGMFEFLGSVPQLGRVLTPADFEGGAPPAVVVSDAFWRKRMNAERSAIGRSITLGGSPFTVVGVMSPGYTFHAFAPDVWLPLTPADLAKTGSIVRVIARLRMPLAAAQSWADTRSAQLATEQPTQKMWKINIAPLDGWRANPDVKRGLWVVLGCAACVLLIGCANTANLMLVRNATRVRDIAVRSALGASRARLARQLLVESVSLAILAGGLGVLLANWLLALVLPLIPSEVIAGSFFAITLDPRVLVITSAVTLGTGLLFGLAPALHGATAGEQLAGRVGRSSAEGRAAGRLRSAVLAAQLAFAAVLLGGAMLFGRSFLQLLRVDAGADVAHLASMSLQLSPVRYPDSTSRRQFYDRLMATLRTVPGVDGVTRTDGAMPNAGFSFGTEIEAQGRPKPTSQPTLLPSARVDTGYFRAAGTPLIAGRGFEFADLSATAPVAVVDEDFARWLWGTESPLGRQFRLSPEDPWMTVVGVAADAKLMGPDDREGQFELYQPLRSASRYSNILLHTTGNPAALLAAARRAVHQLDPSQPVATLETMNTLFADAVAKPRFFLWLMLAFGAAALVLAAIGIYGTASFSARRRSRELAIRMAMGASEGSVLAYVMRQTGQVIAAGMAIGLLATLALAQLVAKLLFDIHATDLASLTSAMALLGVVALVASYLPAARAVRMEPFKVLRSD